MKKLLLNAGNEDTSYSEQNLKKHQSNLPYMMILHRDRFPLVRTHLLPLQQSCRPGSCSPLRWRRNTASEQFCKGSRRSSVHWHWEDIRMGCKKTPDLLDSQHIPQIWSLSDMRVNTSIIQMVPLTFAGYSFFSFLIKRCTDKCSRSLVFRSLSLKVWSPISLTAHLHLCCSPSSPCFASQKSSEGFRNRK